MDCGRVVFDLNIFRPTGNTLGVVEDNKIQNTHSGQLLSVVACMLAAQLCRDNHWMKQSHSKFIYPTKKGKSNCKPDTKAFLSKSKPGGLS